MSSGSAKHSNSTSGRRQYFTKTFCYLLILLAVTVLTIFITIKPVTQLVHKVEENVPMKVRDIELNDSAYNPLSVGSVDETSFHFGDKIANISSDAFGLNCSVYYGSNRVSMSKGVGFSSESGKLGCDGTSLVVGYTESFFSGIEYCAVNDVITVVTNYGEFYYRVTDVKYIADDKDAFKDADDDRLVLKGLTSDFSDHSGESLYVFASRINGEVQ